MMTASWSPENLRQQLAKLRQLIAERLPVEKELPARQEAARRAEEQRYRQVGEQLSSRHQRDRQAVQADAEGNRQAILSRWESQQTAVQREWDQLQGSILDHAREAKKIAHRLCEETQWESKTVLEATKDEPVRRLEQVKAQLATGRETTQIIGCRASQVLRSRRQKVEVPEPKPGTLPEDSQVGMHFPRLLQVAESQLLALEKLRISGLFQGGWPLGVLFILWLILLSGCCLFFGQPTWLSVAAVSGLTALLWIGLGVWFYRISGRQLTEGIATLRQTLVDANALGDRIIQLAEEQRDRESREILTRCQTELEEARHKLSRTATEICRQQQEELQRAEEKYGPELIEFPGQRDRELEANEQQSQQRLRAIDNSFRREKERLTEKHRGEVAAREQDDRRHWQEMADHWRTGIVAFQATATTWNRQREETFLNFHTADFHTWHAAHDVPPAIPFGRLLVCLDQTDGQRSQDLQWDSSERDLFLPAMVPFPCNPLMIHARGNRRNQAIGTIQAVMLRMLLAVPPGKLRFTIIDPVGLGENFSAFMHLADFDETLVTSRIWTEPIQIEQRLADLTQHMETVIQVYLRNEFPTIQAYNAFAGQMAEAYRVLVVANFPANFSEGAVQRLQSIVANGARCGVHVLMSVDAELKWPSNVRRLDLEQRAIHICEKNGQFVWKGVDHPGVSLELDQPPEPSRFTQWVQVVGAEARNADRVEVPFTFVVPEENNWWSGTTRDGIDLPLGLGAGQKLQRLELGQGTAQHVMVSGKTGSGKSNFLHVVISTAAMWYGPDEVEMYLVDFKKGVEFKAYAHFQLPHARVVAIESEREFGLSVLERLDRELKLRGDRYRNLGVQDLSGFRRKESDLAMPRVLLVVDEFQELFVADDRIAHDAALLLDRLVRQGRAFGIHVILGSQTLAGAYSLPRATIGQMAVRVVLPCSEADDHLVLNEDNMAARLLSRPGEAIYNDANGLVEGNRPFQVVWLPDQVRDGYLEKIKSLAESRNIHREVPIVFEGNVLADLCNNRALGQLLAEPRWPQKIVSPCLWLGAAMAMEDPMVCELSRQSGGNFLVVGHHHEAALGVLVSSVLSLAAQQPPRQPGTVSYGSYGASFWVLDGTHPDGPHAGYWQQLGEVVPHTFHCGGPREANSMIEKIADELVRRQQAELDEEASLYLVVYNLSSFRHLRGAEDYFVFTSSSDREKPVDVAKQFGQIVKEGPLWGIHALLWCDTYNNLFRTIDRRGLRDLEQRVLFQMSEVDSSNLIDTPEASRLGAHRALLYHEGLGSLKKLRPYGVPPDDWLNRVRKQFECRFTGTGSGREKS